MLIFKACCMTSWHLMYCLETGLFIKAISPEWLCVKPCLGWLTAHKRCLYWTHSSTALFSKMTHGSTEKMAAETAVKKHLAEFYVDIVSFFY